MFEVKKKHSSSLDP